ncbi:MAG: hypothetical protein Q7S09_02935 [bacterium]|nr:hypothetical protein [bacterium]
MVWRHKESYSPSEKECLLAGQRLFESLVAASEAADVGKIESAITALKAEVGALEKSLAEKIFGDSLTAGVYIQKFRIGLAEAHNRMVFLRVAQTTETS